MKNLYELGQTQSVLFPQKSAYKILNKDLDIVEELTYLDLHQKSIILAQELKRLEAVGRPILLLLPTSVSHMVGFLGCVYSGAIAVPVSMPKRSMHMERLKSILDNAGTNYILTTLDVFGKIKKIAGEDAFFTDVNFLFLDDIDQKKMDSVFNPELNEDRICMLQYTSGSTSTPKGVVLTHKNLLTNFQMMQKGFATDSNSVMITWIPLFHDMGLILQALHSLYIGSTNFMMSPQTFIQNPIIWLKAISKYNGTFSAAPNFAYDLCIECTRESDYKTLDLNSWKTAVNAAEPIIYQTVEKFINKFSGAGLNPNAVSPGYGLAEATVMVSGKNPSQILKKIAVSFEDLKNKVINISDLTEDSSLTTDIVSCGAIVDGLDVKIVDETTRKVCSPGYVGEVWLYGDNITAGYWDNGKISEKISEKHYGILLNDTSQKRYLKTGDLGFLYENELYICGRVKDLIVINGANFYPQDLERIVALSHQAVVSAAVAAFSINSGTGEQVIIVSEINRHYFSGDSSKKHEILTEISSCIKKSIFKEYGITVHDVALIRQVSIPRTTSGKIQRSKCKQQYLENKLVNLNTMCKKPEVEYSTL